MQQGSSSSGEYRVPSWMAELAEDPAHGRRMFRAEVAGKLTALLASVGMSAAKLARKLGVSAPQVSKQLSGDANLTLDSVYNIAKATGARVEIVLTPASTASAFATAESIRMATISATTVQAIQQKLDFLDAIGPQGALNRQSLNRKTLYDLIRGQLSIAGGDDWSLKLDDCEAANDESAKNMAKAA